MDEDVVAIIMFGLIVLVPVAGVTARIALKPVIDSLARIAEARRSTQEVALIEKRLALVEQELSSVRGEVQEATAQADFYRRLAEPTP